MLAIVKCTKQVDWILDNSSFATRVYTDHLSIIQTMSNMGEVHGKVSRWMDKITGFRLQFYHSPAERFRHPPVPPSQFRTLAMISKPEQTHPPENDYEYTGLFAKYVVFFVLEQEHNFPADLRKSIHQGPSWLQKIRVQVPAKTKIVELNRRKCE